MLTLLLFSSYAADIIVIFSISYPWNKTSLLAKHNIYWDKNEDKDKAYS